MGNAMNISDDCYQWLMNMQDFAVEEEFWNKLSQEEQTLFAELRKKNLARKESVQNLENENVLGKCEKLRRDKWGRCKIS